MKKLILLPIILLLAGCVTDQQRAQQAAAQAAQLKAEDHAKCIEYGFKKSTKEYANCRMTIDQERKQRQAAIAAAYISAPAPEPFPIYKPQPYMMQTHRPITCNTFGSTTTCR